MSIESDEPRVRQTIQHELPFQSHSKTSQGGAGRPPKARIQAQEKWVYEHLQTYTPRGLADWQLWRFARRHPQLFEQLSSMRRARIGLVWVNRKIGTTPYHPVEDSGEEILDPQSGVLCAIWRIKPLYRGLPYEKWVETYKALAREQH